MKLLLLSWTEIKLKVGDDLTKTMTLFIGIFIHLYALIGRRDWHIWTSVTLLERALYHSLPKEQVCAVPAHDSVKISFFNLLKIELGKR